MSDFELGPWGELCRRVVAEQENFGLSQNFRIGFEEATTVPIPRRGDADRIEVAWAVVERNFDHYIGAVLVFTWGSNILPIVNVNQDWPFERLHVAVKDAEHGRRLRRILRGLWHYLFLSLSVIEICRSTNC